MQRVVFLTALPVEYKAVCTYLIELQEEMHPQGTIYERGKFRANGQTWDVGIAEVGAGNTGAAIEAERAIAYFKPDILFFVGIAGGIKDVAIGDVVAATKVYGYESGKQGKQFLTRPALGQSNYALVQRAKAEARKGEWLQRLSSSLAVQPRVFVEPIAAGEKVIASKQSDIFKLLRASYNDAIAVEMEGFGFLSAAFAYPNIKAIVIRGISDLIDGKNDDSIESEDIRQKRASHHASAFAFEILSKIQPDEAGKQPSSPEFSLPLLLPESAQPMNSNPNKPPKVFFSYSHDSLEHKERVLLLSNRLRKDGIDSNIDQYEDSPIEGWQRWMLNQVETSDYVLIVCTEQYDRRFRGHEEVGKGKGATWEGGIVIQELYDAQGKNSKFIPVTFADQDSNFIPSPLCSATVYRLYKSDGYELLYRRLTNQHGIRKQNLGDLHNLPPSECKQSFGEEFQGIVTYSINPNTLLTEIGKGVEAAVKDSLISLNDERHKRIDYARNLIIQGQFTHAVQYLDDLKAELWYRSDDSIKYRITANLGLAMFSLEDDGKAAANFLEALQYNPENDRAIAYAALGYLLQRDNDKAKKLIEKALLRNPANELAYSLRVRVAPITDSIESVLAQIPSVYQKSRDVLVALGEAALDRKQFDEAVAYFQIAINSVTDNSMDNVKAFLGIALIESITEKYQLIFSGQILDSEKLRLEKAICLFTEVLGGEYVNPNDLSHLKFTTLVNRASALRLLGRYDKAISSFDMALQKEPNDPYLFKQLAGIAYERGNKEEALKYAKQILSKAPEAHLLVGKALIDLDLFQDAETILNSFLQTDCSINLKQHAKRLLFDLFLANNDPKKAEAILNEVVREDPEELFTFIQQIRWQKINAKDEKIPALIEQAKAAIMPKTSVAEQIYLADILFSFGFYRDATEVYEKFVDPTQSTVLSTQLVEAYYRSGNYKKALILCQHLLEKYGALPIVSEMAAYIYEYIGDMDSSRIICEDFILTFPNELWMQLRLANINYVTGNYQDLDRFLDSKPDTKNLSLAGFLKLAQLNKIRKRIDNLLDVIYLMRQSFYDNMQAHYYYEMLYLEASKIKPVTQDYQTVIDGCGVFVRNEFENEQWFILEDLADANFARSELNTSKALYETLIGKGLGTVDLPDQDSFLCRSWVILVITDKYFAASQLSLKELENQPTNDFKIIAIPMVGDNIANEWVEKFIQELQKHNENFDLIKVDYINGKFPIGTFAYLLRKNPIEIWQNLIWGDYPFIHSWSDFQNEKFDDALITLQKGGLVVIDPISLITLHQLDVADDVVGVVGKFGIAHSTIDLFSMMLEMSQGIQGEGFTGFGANKGQGFFLDISPEQIAKQSDFLEKIINWARDNCMILPCLGALDINKDEHDRLKECIGSAFIDTKLIAAESGRILYSDDQWLRWYARLDTGVKGVWTQVILKYCFVQRNSNISLYSKSSLELVIHGYSYTIMDADILMEAAKLSKWQPAPIYKSALRALGDIKNTNLEYIAFISADFLRHLYLEAILTENTLIDPRDTLVFELLKIITSARSQTSLGRLIKEAIEKRFELIPIQKAKVLLAINSWLSIQSIIT